MREVGEPETRTLLAKWSELLMPSNNRMWGDREIARETARTKSGYIYINGSPSVSDSISVLVASRCPLNFTFQC